MKVLFIENKLRIDKLGMLYISAVLKQHGHSVDMIQTSIDGIEEYLYRNPIDFICYSVMSGEHKWYLKLNDELKQKFSFKSIFGGPHFTFFSEKEKTNPNIDYIVIGPGELVINDIVTGKITDKIVKGILPDLELLPPPDRSILYKYEEFKSARMKRFISSRDCPNACTYCFNHIYHKIFNDQKTMFFKRTSPQKMIDEIINVKNNYILETVYFNDDDLISDKEWITEFLLSYKEKINLPFCGSLRANNLTPEITKLLKDSNCYFMNIALESANTETQRLLRRGNISNTQVLNAVHLLESNGIKVRLQNMIGMPVKDPLADALETFEFNKLAAPTDSWASILQPFYGTEIWKHCITNNLINKDVDCMNFYEETQLNIPNQEEINNLHKWWYFAVKYKLPVELLKILIKQPLTTETKNEIQQYRWNLTSKEIYKI